MAESLVKKLVLMGLVMPLGQAGGHSGDWMHPSTRLAEPYSVVEQYASQDLVAGDRASIVPVD